MTTLNFTLEQLLKLSIEEIFEKLDLNLSLNREMQNMGLVSGDHLTLAGLLLFGDSPQSFRPVLNMQCASFLGNDIKGLLLRSILAAIYGHYQLRIRNMKFQRINLEQKVMERTGELNEANKKLQKPDRVKNDS